MDSLMFSSNSHNNYPQIMNSNTTTGFPSSSVIKTATCSLQQQLNPNPNHVTGGLGTTLMFTTASASVRKKCGSGMTRYNQSNCNNATPRTHPNSLYDCNPYNYYSGLSQVSLLECLSIATPTATTTAATTITTSARNSSCKRRYPSLDNNTSSSKKPKKTNGSVVDKATISIGVASTPSPRVLVAANTSPRVQEAVGATATHRNTKHTHATTASQKNALESNNNSFTVAAASGSILESVGTLNSISTTPIVQQQPRLSSPNRNNYSVDSLSQLLPETPMQQRHLENTMPLTPLQVTDDMSSSQKTTGNFRDPHENRTFDTLLQQWEEESDVEPNWNLAPQPSPRFPKETLTMEDLHKGAKNVENSRRNLDEQPIELGNFVTSRQIQVENCRNASEQHMEKGRYVHEQSTELSNTIIALQEEGECNEILNHQHMEQSKNVHEQSTQLSNTITALQKQVVYNEILNDQREEKSRNVHEQSTPLTNTIIALQEQLKITEIVNDQQMESSRYVHNQSADMTNTVNAFQEQVGSTEFVNNQQMECGTYVHKQPTELTNTITSGLAQVELAEVVDGQQMESSIYVQKQSYDLTSTVTALQEQVEFNEIVNDQQKDCGTYAHEQLSNVTNIITTRQEQVELAEIFDDQQMGSSRYVHKQSADMTNTVTTLQEQAEIAEIINDPHLDNSGNFQETSPDLTTTITALQEQVEYNEVFGEQHFENSIYICKQSTDLTKTIIALQDQVERGDIVNDLHIENNRYLHEQSTDSTNNIAVLQEQVEYTEFVNNQHMENSRYLHEQSTDLTNTITALQKQKEHNAIVGEQYSNARLQEQNEQTTAFFPNRMLELSTEKLKILPVTTQEAAENVVVQNEITLLAQNPTDYTQQQGHDHYDGAIHLFLGQSSGAVENITMEQTMEFTVANDGKDGDRNVEINEMITANKTCEHLGVEQSLPNLRGPELEIINDNGNGDESPRSEIPLEQCMNLEEFIQNFTRNLRENQDLHPYMVTDSRCHKCAKRCPRVVSFGCNYAAHRLCGKHVEMLLGLNFTDITGPSANFKHCPICCFKCSCSLCKSRLQKQWREHRHKENNSLVCCSMTGDGDTIDESPFLISGNENVELDSNVVGIPKQHDTINISSIEYEGNNEKCSPLTNKDCTRNESMLQRPDDKLLLMDTSSEVKEVQNSLLEKNEFSINEIIFRKVAEMHPMSHSKFVEIINREKQKYPTCPSIYRDKQCHICRKRHSEVVWFGCRFSSHAYCKMHVERHLGMTFDLQELQSKCNFCPICCFLCPCPTCKRAVDKLWNDYEKYVEKQKQHNAPIAVDQDMFASNQTRRKQNSIIKMNVAGHLKDSKDRVKSPSAFLERNARHNLRIQATEEAASKDTKPLALGAPIPFLFSKKENFVEKIKLMNRRLQNYTPTITHNQICHICKLRRPDLINFGCEFDIRHAFCEKHARTRLGMENLSLVEIKSKLKHCPICCLECECAKCHRKANHLWAQQAEFQSRPEKILVTIVGKEATKLIFCDKAHDGKLIELSAKDFVEDSEEISRLKEPESKELRSAYLMDLKRLKQEREKIHPSVLANFNCHICKKRVLSAINFGCLAGDNHALCERHVKKWFGTESLSLQEIASKLRYCPICCFECECAKCLREVDSLWEEKIEVLTPEIPINRSSGMSEPSTSNLPPDRGSDNSNRESLTSESNNNHKSVVMEQSAEAFTLESSIRKDSETVSPETCMNLISDAFQKQSEFNKSERTVQRTSHEEEETIEALLSKADSKCDNENETQSKADSNCDNENETKGIPLGANSCISDNEVPPTFSFLTSLGVRAVEKAVIYDQQCSNHGNFCDLNSVVADEDVKEQFTTSIIRPKNMKKCPFIGKSHVNWFCYRCQEHHWVETRNALYPFSKKHGYRFEHVEADGDCFFTW